MKICSYCAENIQEEAKICRYCWKSIKDLNWRDKSWIQLLKMVWFIFMFTFISVPILKNSWINEELWMLIVAFLGVIGFVFFVK